MTRQITAVALAITMSVIGVPARARAAGQESPEPRHPLVLNGRPLSQVLQGGQIVGVVVDTEGKPLANHGVSLRNLSGASPLEAITDVNGRFSFAALSPGRYVVDVLLADLITASSGTIAVVEGGMTFTKIGGATAASTANGQRGKGVLFWMAVGAGAGAAVGSIAIADGDCEGSDSLCALAPFYGATMGTMLGFFFGLGR